MTQFEGFVPPNYPPQLESEANAPVSDLINEAPPWDEAYALELAVLCRRHVVIRSAIDYAKVLAGFSKDIMVNESDPVELYRRQGAVKALTQFHNTLVSAMSAAQNEEEIEQ